jgi:glycosyltransferase involved in cell wall biosynthesis
VSGPGQAGPEVAPTPTVSVVVPTRNRPAEVLPCVTTILANEPLLELILVDQSDGDATGRAVASVRDPRFRYVRSDLRGVTNGRNTGIELARGQVVAFTDDDCRAPPDWVAQIARVFSEDPDAAVVCGRVCVPEGTQKGYAISFEPVEREWKGRYPPPDRDWGLTANMAFRRELFAGVGVFDPFLGVGAPLRSGGEPDLLFRFLRAGLKVVNAREVQVDHLGFRAPGAATTGLMRQYAAGTAAALFKHVRLGDLHATRLFLGHLSGCVRLVFTNAVHLHRPLGIGYTLAFLSGVKASWRYRIDRRKRVYAAK